MNKQNLLFAMVSTLLLLFVSLGCGGGGAQTDEANKLINEANKIVDDAKDLVVKNRTTEYGSLRRQPPNRRPAANL